MFLNIIKEAILKANSKSNIIDITPTHFHNVVQVKNSYLDTTKLTNYGYKCKYNIDTIIDKLVTFYQTHE